MKILVTGATGFVGQELIKQASKKNINVDALVRRSSNITQHAGTIKETKFSAFTSEDLEGKISEDTSVVIHLASRVHQMNEAATDLIEKYRDINVRGSLALLKEAIKCNVKHFIYVSTIKVNGETSISTPFTHLNSPAPSDPYSKSKYEAEEALKELASESGVALTIIRPPLVYGPGVKGNLKKLEHSIRYGKYLPLGGINNKRDLVSVYNLVDFILHCANNSTAYDQTFLICDDSPLSTTDIVKNMAAGIGKPAKLLPIPVNIIKRGLKLVGKQGLSHRLLGDLQINIEHTKKTTGWEPPFTPREGFMKSYQDCG